MAYYEGQMIPFGAQIMYKPITAKDETLVHQVVNKMLDAIFMGYVQKVVKRW